MIAAAKADSKSEEWLQKSVELIEKRGFKEIKSKLDGYDEPISFDQKNSDTNYTPDITAVGNHGKAYFEIAQKTDDVTALVSKWKLLSTIAEMKQGSLHIIVPYGQNKFTQEVISKYNIEADIIKLD
ncbi:MAG: hypothetical protein RIC95_10210 [Vicingaceae bacterium]